jgi:hypothetical protein
MVEFLLERGADIEVTTNDVFMLFMEFFLLFIERLLKLREIVGRKG